MRRKRFRRNTGRHRLSSLLFIIRKPLMTKNMLTPSPESLKRKSYAVQNGPEYLPDNATYGTGLPAKPQEPQEVEVVFPLRRIFRPGSDYVQENLTAAGSSWPQV
jgi:hypothetical protein